MDLMMNLQTVWKRATFDAAHHLPNYKGACSRVHGHTYTVELGVTGAVSATNGMVLDMKELGAVLHTIIAEWDHRDLNELFETPTAEFLAQRIFVQAQYAFPHNEIRVRLWETPDSWVEVNL